MHQPFYFFVFFFLAFAKISTAQNTTAQPPAVELIEEKEPKRWMLYAQNNTDTEHEAFLIVQGEGFRRSADRPVIKKIPPKSKVLMITLIPLKGKEPTYTKIFTFEEQLQTISRRKGEDREEYVNIRPIREDEFTLFTENDCPKCKRLINYLNKEHLKYRTLKINTNHKVSEFMFDALAVLGEKTKGVRLPVIIYKGQAYHDIPSIEQFIRTFNWSALK